MGKLNKIYKFFCNFIAIRHSTCICNLFADSHEPISVLGEHIHKENEVMFSYRLSFTEMNKNLNVTKNSNLKEIVNAPNGASNNSSNYIIAPENI